MASFQPDSDNTIYQENANSADDGTTLFLGDLSVYSTENHIRELFQPYGKIENVRIKRGNSTKPHLCYGFIKFDSRTAAEKALSGLNGVMFLGRTLRSVNFRSSIFFFSFLIISFSTISLYCEFVIELDGQRRSLRTLNR